MARREDYEVFEKIVLPLDGSPTAEAALQAAIEMASKFGSRVWLLRVVPSAAAHIAQMSPVLEAPGAAAADVELIEKVQQEEHAEAEAYLNAVKSRFSGHVEMVIKEGVPADQIADLAQEAGADLIVMSSHGRSGISRLVFGSVADRVLKESQVPVLLIRNKAAG